MHVRKKPFAAWQVRMTAQPIARFTGRHGLSAGGAFGAARAEVQYSFSPMADPLLYKDVDRINLHPLPRGGTIERYDWAGDSRDR